MPEIVDIPVADLLVDTRNARLKDEQPSQQAALLALARQQGKRLLNLAANIVDKGLDPTTLTAVVATNDQKKRYVVLEGNRRLAALKALETPALISSALDAKGQKQLNQLARRFAQKPVSTVKCVLFETEGEANHWITLRHTGQNEGIGLVEWGADEKDRYAARHGHRSPAGQILDFVEKHGSLSDNAQQSNRGIITSLTRLINDPNVRSQIGIELENGQVLSWYPNDEVAKSLTRIVEDLKTGQVRVGNIYHAEDRAKYAETLATSLNPASSPRLGAPRPLGSTDGAGVSTTTRRPPSSRKRKAPAERTAVIPRNCRLNIDPPRINAIYNELSTLSVDQYPNACAVLLRVFLELSVDHYIEKHSLMTEDDRRKYSLAKRLKAVAGHLRGTGSINSQLEIAVQKIADSQFIVAASTVSFNQYVHNQYVFPKTTELKVAWDELQPLMEKLWPSG